MNASLLTFVAVLGAAPAAPEPTLDALRDEAAAVVRIQTVLDWYTQTVGEPSIRVLLYKGHERLFTPASVAVVAKALKRKDLDPDERRALQFFKSYLSSETLAQAAARFDDEAANAALKTEVPLSWRPEPTPYKQLEVLLKTEQDAAKRAAIEKAQATVWKDVLNPILARKEEETQKLAKTLGYGSYVALSEESRMVSLKDLLAEGNRFLQATDALYQPLLAEVAKKELGLEVSKLHRADIVRMRNAPRFERFFPKDLMRPAFEFFLKGLGLDLKTAAGTTITIDDAPNPLKEPRAACFSVHVPDDIRVSVKPSDGLQDFVTFFHEGGHALHFANSTTTRWELKYLGPNALTESWAEVFGKSWGDPNWLRRYREFVVQYNAQHKTKVPTMSDGEIAELSRMGVYSDFYFLRRYSYAKIIYEAVLHGGDPSIWAGVYTKPTGDPMAVYQDVFGKAYGFPMGAEDAQRFRTDVDDTFYAADYARAFALADLVQEALRRKYGGANGDWFGNPTAGAELKRLYAAGQKWQPDEIAQHFGEQKLTFNASIERARRLLGQAAAPPGGGTAQ
ncbi:MAG TPA: hypothetical protein VIG99_06005 [Myxococcaceae bacterium]|jgi:hypothetical protein